MEGGWRATVAGRMMGSYRFDDAHVFTTGAMGLVCCVGMGMADCLYYDPTYLDFSCDVVS